MKNLVSYLVILCLSGLLFTSCGQMKQEAYDNGYKVGYQKGREDYFNELEEKRIEESKRASRFNEESAERDLKYYFELYKPTERIIQSSLKIRKIEDYKFNIQLQSTEPDIFDSEMYNLHSYIFTLTYNSVTEKFSLDREGYSMVRKYK